MIRRLVVTGSLTIALNDLSLILSFVLFELLSLLLMLLHELLLVLLPLLGLQSVLLGHLLIKLVEVTTGASAKSGCIFVTELGVSRAEEAGDQTKENKAADKDRFHLGIPSEGTGIAHEADPFSPSPAIRG